MVHGTWFRIILFFIPLINVFFKAPPQNCLLMRAINNASTALVVCTASVVWKRCSCLIQLNFHIFRSKYHWVWKYAPFPPHPRGTPPHSMVWTAWVVSKRFLYLTQLKFHTFGSKYYWVCKYAPSPPGFLVDNWRTLQFQGIRLQEALVYKVFIIYLHSSLTHWYLHWVSLHSDKRDILSLEHISNQNRWLIRLPF